VVAVDHTRGNAVALRWLLYDGHGNLVRLMASDYTLSAFQWRGVWGEGQGSLGTGRGYCANLGHPEDETGLVYMRARYYEPATGRFISEDPAWDGLNWYLYAEGNPTGRVDASGRSAEWSQLWFGIGLELSIIAFGIVALSSTDPTAIEALKNKLPLSKTIEWMNYAAASIAAIAMAAFGVAAVGLHMDISMSRLISVSRFYLAVASAIVGAFQKAGKLSSFAPAGVAIGAAFTYALLTMTLININEFEESLSTQ
jgi:RHS repeat-associated protein